MAARIMTFIALIFGFFCLSAYSARLFDRRNDLITSAPAAALGWTVPLQAGEICEASKDCKQMSHYAVEPDRLTIMQVTTLCLLLPPTNHLRFWLLVEERSTTAAKTPNRPTHQPFLSSILNSTTLHPSSPSWWTRRPSAHTSNSSTSTTMEMPRILP